MFSPQGYGRQWPNLKGMDYMYSLQQASKMTGISYWTLHSWADLGVLPTTRIGRAYAVTIADVMKTAISRKYKPQKRQEPHRIFS